MRLVRGLLGAIFPEQFEVRVRRERRRRWTRCFAASGIRTRTGQRDNGNGRCSGANRPNKPGTSSPLSRLSMAIPVSAVTNLQPIPTARSGRRLSKLGTRKRAPNSV
jgi:hypothetical protein